MGKAIDSALSLSRRLGVLTVAVPMMTVFLLFCLSAVVTPKTPDLFDRYLRMALIVSTVVMTGVFADEYNFLQRQEMMPTANERLYMFARSLWTLFGILLSIRMAYRFLGGWLPPQPWMSVMVKGVIALLPIPAVLAVVGRNVRPWNKDC
ncbi:MAG: hypothetical protein HGA31_04335 [Candidatus Moranbacteria bacterium]|nr:hypothetical protein [Candidatus Moranbacteria bacterium]